MPTQSLGTVGYQNRPSGFEGAGEMFVKGMQFQQELKLRKQLAKTEEEKLKISKMSTTMKALEQAQTMIKDYNVREQDPERRQQFAGMIMKRVFGNQDDTKDVADTFKEFGEFQAKLEPPKEPEGFVRMPDGSYRQDPTNTKSYKITNLQATEDAIKQTNPLSFGTRMKEFFGGPGAQTPEASARSTAINDARVRFVEQHGIEVPGSVPTNEKLDQLRPEDIPQEVWDKAPTKDKVELLKDRGLL